MNQKSAPTGFTLLELLIVVGILSLLTLAAFASLDPLKQFADGRNARRWSDVATISTGIYRFIIETESLPEGIGAAPRQIGSASSGCSSTCPGASDSCIDLAPQLEPYLFQMPADPKGGTPERTLYTVAKNDNNVIVVAACQPENSAKIFIAR